MNSVSGCGGGYIHYDMDVTCSSCGRLAHIKLLKSRDNQRRLFYKCYEYGKFVKWAKPMEHRWKLLDEEELSKHVMANVVR